MKKTPAPKEINLLAVLFSDGKYTEVVTHAQRLTVRYPTHAFGWMMMGIAFGQMGRNADALELLRKAAALSPGDAGILINLSKILQGLWGTIMKPKRASDGQ